VIINKHDAGIEEQRYLGWVIREGFSERETFRLRPNVTVQRRVFQTRRIAGAMV
jgi:hypothetical protein